MDIKLAEPTWPVMPEGNFSVTTLDIDTDQSPGSGVEDFDRENAEDPQQHSEYAMETFQYYKNREETFRVPDYLQVIVIYFTSKVLIFSQELFMVLAFINFICQFPEPPRDQ